MPYLRKRSLTPALKELKYIADALGEVRDHDVALLALEDLQKRAPADSAGVLKQLIETRQQLREQTREELRAILEKDELKRLESEFRAGIEEAISSSGRRNKEAPTRPEPLLVDVARAIILDRLREFEKLTNSLFEPFAVDALHELRIAAKRLRYAVELFQPCWPRSLSTCAKRAARIQTALGDLHDCDVWIESLGKHIIRSRKQKQKEQVVPYVWLLNHFIELRTKHLHRALVRWREWETHDTSGKLRAAITPQEKKAEPETSAESSGGQADATGLVAVG
jgi:CHAD domain-containing protein